MKQIIYISLSLFIGYLGITYIDDFLFPPNIESRLEDVEKAATYMIQNGYMGNSCDRVQNQKIYNALIDKSQFEPYKNDEDHFWNLFQNYPDCIKKATLQKLSSKTNKRYNNMTMVYGIYRGENDNYICELQIAFFINIPQNLKDEKEESGCNIAIFYKNMDIPLGKATEFSF